eukprot:3740710-Rhodomonas_salina.1
MLHGCGSLSGGYLLLLFVELLVQLEQLLLHVRSLGVLVVKLGRVVGLGRGLQDVEAKVVRQSRLLRWRDDLFCPWRLALTCAGR